MQMTTTRWLGAATLCAAAVCVAAYRPAHLPDEQAASGTAAHRSAPPAAAARMQQALPAGHPLAPEVGDGRAVQPELAGLHERVDALAQELALLRQQLGRGGPREARSEASAEDVIRERTDPAARAEAERAARDAEREAGFRAEPVDPTWANNVTAVLRNALAGDAEAGPIAVRSLECRSRSCRVEIDDAGPGDGDRSVRLLGPRMAGTLGSMAASRIDIGGGNSATVLHLSR